MNWKFGKKRNMQDELSSGLKNLKVIEVQKNYKIFHKLISIHDHVLKLVSDLEEKAQGEYLFDINYILNNLSEIQSGVGSMVDMLNKLGENRYLVLKDVLETINKQIESSLPGKQPIEEDSFTIPLDKLTRESAGGVGSKNAQLGELKTKLGLTVPEGFAITAWAYKIFLEFNNLQKKIPSEIYLMDIKKYDELCAISENIRDIIMESPLPVELEKSIIDSYQELKEQFPDNNVVLRSSALGEDTQFSFAGQYKSFLNVTGEELIDRYREVLASKFTPKAIYYYLGHSISESDLAMAVACLAMIDAQSSGVVYTRNPVDPSDDCVVINSIFGLGKYLVDGTLTPDTFMVPRNEQPGAIKKQIVKKEIRLVAREGGGTAEEPVPESEQDNPSLNDDQLKELAEVALKIEEHYGCPQDIEWAIDRNGKLFILQTRPLRIIEKSKQEIEPDISTLEVVASGGTSVCPGAGSGKIFIADSPEVLPYIPGGAVLVIPYPYPGLIIVMDKVNAIIAKVGSSASHMATLAREKRIPTIVGFDSALELPAGKTVTVDATNGIIYAGEQLELIEARRPEYELFESTELFTILGRVLTHITPLKMFNPSGKDFVAGNCETFHDVIRFVHQKSNEEMFGTIQKIDDKDKLAIQLKTDIPLPLKLIYIDDIIWKYMGREWIEEEEIESVPMKSFWKGIKEEGWPAAPQVDMKGFSSVVSTHFIKGGRQEFLESSFAILSKEYMLINLRMGYHFSSIEARCTKEREDNFIYIQYKEGGASLDRRIRRIKLITDLLSCMGFENFSKGDFLHAGIAFQQPEVLQKKLQYLGRISMLTKQLDMVLSSDEVAKMITKDFISKLGLKHYLD